MKKHGYKTEIEVGDYYEFCIINNKGVSEVHYGVVRCINSENRSFVFEGISYDRKMNKVPNGTIYENVTSVRGVGMIDERTWEGKDES